MPKNAAPYRMAPWICVEQPACGEAITTHQLDDITSRFLLVMLGWRLSYSTYFGTASMMLCGAMVGMILFNL